MTTGRPSRVERVFRALVRARWPILALYAAALPLAVLLALRVPNDSGIDRLVVASDPDAVRTREFQKVFPDTPRIVLVAQSPRIFEPEGLDLVRRLERRLSELPRTHAVSAVSLFERARPGLSDPAEFARAFAAFARGSRLLRGQGLAGEDWLGLPIGLDVTNASERDEALAGVERAIEGTLAGAAPSLSSPVTIRRVGGPFVESWIESATRASSRRTLPLFGLFVVGLTLFLYRSIRALLAILVSLGVSVALTVGAGALAGWSFTILSSLVPLTVLVTATATLVYVHSRFVDCPHGVDPFDHQPVALANKLVPCAASLFAAAVGFAALAVSNIRPVREMGLWTALGLVLTGLVVFTLFPALQRVLRTPTRHERRVAAGWYAGFAERLPGWSWRWRWALVGASLALTASGAAALFGVPGVVEPMSLETDSLAYVPADLPVGRDTRWFETQIGGLSVVDAWIQSPPGALLEPEVLRGLEGFARRAAIEPDVSSVTGPTTLLSWMRALGGESETLPEDPTSWEKLAGDLEQLVLQQPELRAYLDTASLAQARLTIIHRSGTWEAVRRLDAALQRAWAEAARETPALGACRMELVGQGLLQAKIARNLVPTLTQSFALTAGIIFLTFLAVFRSGAARLLAMIPSVFALLVTFLLMRALAIPLNVATILIASVVLGASENDQIHFFYHYQEKRRGGAGSAEAALRHTLQIAGRAILFATLINAGGFLALALSHLPPMRQFGIVSASAFLLSMLADFTVLPAALWLVFRQRPGVVRANDSV